MATATMSPLASHSHSRPQPAVSSPLAASSSSSSLHPGIAAKRSLPKRNPSFPSSQPLRPFASVSHILNPSSAPNTSAKKPVKLIEPSKNHRGTFVLNLTQAEFSRQD